VAVLEKYKNKQKLYKEWKKWLDSKGYIYTLDGCSKNLNIRRMTKCTHECTLTQHQKYCPFAWKRNTELKSKKKQKKQEQTFMKHLECNDYELD
jgi:hypothetical protein